MVWVFGMCWLNRHKPRRNRIKWDGYHFVSKCASCGTRIRRRASHRWEADWMAQPSANNETTSL